MPSVQLTPRGIAAAIFGMALALRLVLLAETSESPYAQTLLLDAAEYQHLARGLLEGTWSDAAEQTYVHGILYPVMWAAIEACGGGVTTLLLLQAILGAATCVLIFAAARHLLAPAAAILCGILAGVYWPLLLFGAQPLATTLVVFLVAGLLAWLSRPSTTTWHSLVASGLLLALLGATRANTLLLVPVVAWWAITRSRAAGRSSRTTLLWLSAGIGIGLAPFVTHNMMTQGTPLPYEGAWSLHMGNNPAADGTPYARQGIGWQRLESLGYRDGWQTTPAQRGRTYLVKAAEFWAGQPLQALQLTYQKLRLFWNVFEVPVSVDLAWFDEHTTLGRWLPATFGLLAPLALLGMVLNLRRWRSWSLAYGGIFAFLLSGLLFTVCARYRLPAVPFLLLFAADALHHLADSFRAGNRRALTRHGAVLLAAAVFVHTGVDPVRANHLRPLWLQGEILLRENRPLEAQQTFRRSLEVDPRDPDVQNSLAVTLERQNQIAAAEKRYREALKLAPDHSRVAINLARLLGRSGRLPEGKQLAAMVLRVDPRPRMQHDAYLCRGILRRQSGEYRLAYKDLHAAIDILDRAQPRYTLAHVCHQLGQVEEEVTHLERAVELEPGFAAAHLNLGSLHLMQGDLQAAEVALKRAVALKPTLATAHAHLSIVYQRTGRLELSRAAQDLAGGLRAGLRRPTLP